MIIALFTVEIPALACEYCLGTGTADSGLIRALFFSMGSLLTVVGLVGFGVGAFFVKTHLRAKVLESERASDHQDDLLLTNNLIEPKHE